MSYAIMGIGTYGYAGLGAVDYSALGPNPPTIRLGSTGVPVTLWQTFLGVSADGKFGPATLAATKSFQAAHGLTADGIVGMQTWGAAKAVVDAQNAAAPVPSSPPPTVPPNAPQPTAPAAQVVQAAQAVTVAPTGPDGSVPCPNGQVPGGGSSGGAAGTCVWRGGSTLEKTRTWWSVQPPTMKYGLIGGSALLALLVVLKK